MISNAIGQFNKCFIKNINGSMDNIWINGKPKDTYKTCDWEDFHTFDCLNGRETIWEASKRALFSTILAPDQIRLLRLQRPSKNLKTYIRPVFGVIFIPFIAEMAEKQFGRPLNGPFSARFWLQIRSGCSDCNGLQKTCRHI